MNIIQKYGPGLILCIILALPSWILGKHYPVIGGPIIAIITGMILSQILKNKAKFEAGIKYTSKKILQYAVILLGFGLNFSVVLETGKQSLPIIITTIGTSLLIAFILHKVMNIPASISTLIGVGSSICGGSAIAATAPVIEADDEEVAQAISVIFFFNVIAAVLFPVLGSWLGFSTSSGEAFGIFAGTAINDTSSVTAAASTWDSMFQLGSETLDKAITVKLTRTLAIIPITLALALLRSRRERSAEKEISIEMERCTEMETGRAKETGPKKGFHIKKIFPVFILYFILASVITTVAINLGISRSVFTPFKELSKFFIILAMAAIGLNTDLIKLIKNGGKPILMGFCCWIGITIVSLALQHLLGIW